MTILLDFESRSRADLKRVGGRNYWAHPSTEAVCCVLYSTESEQLEVWTRGDGTPAMLESGEPLGAHNMMGFDRFGLEALEWPHDPAELVDTSELARTAGLPGALDALATRWLGLAKDKEASRFTRSLSTPSRAKATMGQLPELTPAVMARVVPYCISDVEIMAHGWTSLEPWLELEPDVVEVERAVNDRGICFDSELAKVLLECDARNAERVIDRVAAELRLLPEHVREIASSPQQFCEWTGAPNAQKETIEAMLMAGPGHPADSLACRAYALATVRQATASIARGKLQAGLARVSPDGRLRDSHRYYGAHTGRWSGRGMQLQNMPRPTDAYEGWGDEQIEALIEHALAGGDLSSIDIDLLLRATLQASAADYAGGRLIVSDFSGVEARALAWAAGDQKALEVFASGRDPYKVMASTIFGDPYEAIAKGEKRTVGKMAELACGYGMGANKFTLTASKAGVDLEAIGVSSAEVVAGWRLLHAPIVRLWKDAERALAAAVQGRETRFACFVAMPSSDGDDAVAIVLPSGRPVVYNGAEIGRGKYGPSLTHAGHRGRTHIYGGMIVENIIQALCRDLMADAMVRAERAGLPVVLHVHDEVVSDVSRDSAKDAAAELNNIMTTVPAWAKGFPIGASGHTGFYYRK